VGLCRLREYESFEGDKGMGRGRDGEMERRGDWETERWRDGETERRRDGERERWIDEETERTLTLNFEP
jgi:hypothetical protein